MLNAFAYSKLQNIYVVGSDKFILFSLSTICSLMKLYFSAYNEIFLNTEPAVFDRNRLYGGIGYRINKNIRLEAGYMNQFFEKNSSDQINIVTFVNF